MESEVPAAAAIAGLLLGAAATVGLQDRAPSALENDAASAPARMPPETFLAWVPRGLPEGFDEAVQGSSQAGRVTTIAQDNAWLVRSWTADGEPVDRPSGGFQIPLDTIAVDPASFAAFLPAPDRP